MRRTQITSSIAAAALVLAATDRSASAQVAIEHAAVGCVITDSYPVFHARFEPAGSVARARVQFRAHGSPHWYFVEMEPSGESFRGVLPKPRKETTQIDYYIEALDRSFAAHRTPEHTPAVVEGAGACQPGAVLAATSAAARVLLGVPAGAPAAPIGFATTGVTTIAGAGGAAAAAAGGAGGAAAGGAAAGAAGGGLPVAVIVGGAVAAAAGTAAVVAAGKGGGDEGGPISLEGEVRQVGRGAPGPTIAGAVISTSLDSNTTTSDASGRFRLVTATTDSRYCCEPYTVRATAPGCRPFSESAVWGEHPRNLTLTLNCP